MMEIEIQDDFDLDKIADSGQCFRWLKDAPDRYRLIHRSDILFIRHIENNRYELSCNDEKYRETWHDYFDLGEDYRAVRLRIDKEEDPFLFSACEYGKGIRILRQDFWETLISFIISQNKNIPAIKKSIELLCESAGERLEGEDGCYYLFPTADAILAMTDDELAACKLGYRCRYLKAAARDWAEGKLCFGDLSAVGEEAARKALMSVCGVGAKVANCVSLFGLHYIDAFPVDVWIKRILENEYPGGYPMEKYRPYNGIYQQYMFYYYRDRYGK